MKAIILINKLSENPLPDELDVLEQVKVVEQSLIELGHKVERVFMDIDLKQAEKDILSAKPDFVFNLYEGTKGKTDMLYLAAGLLQNLKIPYTGCGVDSIFITADKALTKKILKLNNIPTADWYLAKDYKKISHSKKYIVKPLMEDASVGITEKSVINGDDLDVIDDYFKQFGNNFFIEEYIDGREFNISVVVNENGHQILTPAEIIFSHFPENKPKILGYEAKWVENSFEYKNTNRTFDFPSTDTNLLEKIDEIVSECWNALNLRGYARVDIRVDENNQPFVLEINANPCISADSGFYAAVVKSGLSFTQIIEQIVADALRN